MTPEALRSSSSSFIIIITLTCKPWMMWKSQAFKCTAAIKSSPQIYGCHGRVALSKAYNYYHLPEAGCSGLTRDEETVTSSGFWSSGFGGSGFRVQCTGFRVQGFWSRIRVWGSRFRISDRWEIWGWGSRFQGLGSGFRFQVSGSELRVQDSGFRVQDLRLIIYAFQYRDGRGRLNLFCRVWGWGLRGWGSGFEVESSMLSGV